jgi:hypothetical protein
MSSAVDFFCADCGNRLDRRETVQGRFPSYVRPSPKASRFTFYALDDPRPRDPLCRGCWEAAVAVLKAARPERWE